MTARPLTRQPLTVVLGAVMAVGLVACSGGSGSGSGSSGGSSSASGSATPLGPVAPSSTPASASPSATGAAAALLDRAKTALTSASSLRISGGVVQSNTTVALNLGYGANGTSGSVTTSGNKVDIITLAGYVYFRAPDAYWRKQAGAKAAQVLAIVSGKYVRVPASNSNVASFVELADKSQFVSNLFGDTSSVKLGGTMTIAGQACQALTESDGTLWVAKSTSRPLQLDTDASSGGAGVLNFSDYGAVPTPTLPPAAQIVDYTKLQQ